MEKIKFILLVLLTAATLVIVSSCSKDSSGNPLEPEGNNGKGNNSGSQASVTLNGDGFNNEKITAFDGAVYYDRENDATYLSITAKAGSDTAIVLLAFASDKTGTFLWDNEEGVAYLILASQSKVIGYVSSNSGSVTITEYGAVNQYVKGRFEGVVYQDNTNIELTLSGTFSVKRISDQ